MTNNTSNTPLHSPSANAHLFTLFSQGINWNGLFYLFSKTLSILLTALMFNYLATTDFSTWANVNSMLFLILLWIDCGFRKSVPRYVPEYAQSVSAYHTFIRAIIIWQLCVLIMTLPLFIYAAHTVTPLLGLQHNLFLFYAAAPLFLAEGIVAILRLIYHAHFWNKQFNTLSGAILLVETTISIGFIIYLPTSLAILKAILTIKTIGSTALAIVASIQLPTLLSHNNHTINSHPSHANCNRAFIKHSAFMWATTAIKSLSERNFMIPLLTYTLGPIPANLFKVANDGALFFYRSIIKTIGTADTAILAHAEVAAPNTTLTQAFTQLINTVINLCLPLIAVAGILAANSTATTINPSILQAFCIITMGYLIEAILSPYERILEVKHQYLTLCISYIPYFIGMLLLMMYNLIPHIGLIQCIIIIQCIRICGSFIMTIRATQKYHLPLPKLRDIYNFLLIAPPTILASYIIANHTATGRYIQILYKYIIQAK